MDRHKVSKTGDCRKLLGQPHGRNASSMTKIRSMFTLICCSLAGLKMSLRTGFCCRNFLAQDKMKVHWKLYLSLPHIGILGVPSPNCMLHLQFWDGAPPAVLGWHLLTVACLGVHGYVLVLDGRLPYTCTTSAKLLPLTTICPSFLDCGNEVDAWPAARCP